MIASTLSLATKQNLMTGLALDVADESYAAAIFLIGWVVQPLSGRQPRHTHQTIPSETPCPAITIRMRRWSVYVMTR